MEHRLVELEALIERVEGHSFWVSYFTAIVGSINRQVGLHVAVFAEPFLSLVLNGQKTIESRFSRNRCSPYGEVMEGDIILIKEVAGPITGITLAKQTWAYDLALHSLDQLKDEFGSMICGDDVFWDDKRQSAYATLIKLTETAPIQALSCNKRDRRGWVTLWSRQAEFAF